MRPYIRKFKTLIKIIYYYLISLSGSKRCDYYNATETVQLAVRNRKSIVRLGDGEFNIISGKSVSYQQKNKRLREDICDIIAEYINNQDNNFILCMPGEFLSPNGIKLNFKQIISWAFSRYYFNKNYDIPIIYGDAFLFGKGNEEIYSLIWKEESVKHIVFVHNDQIYGEQFKKRYKKEITFIQIPSRDAYSIIKNIENKIIKSIKDSSESVILISAGPCAKVLVKKLADKGYWAIDTGHCWDNPLNLRK